MHQVLRRPLLDPVAVRRPPPCAARFLQPRHAEPVQAAGRRPRLLTHFDLHRLGGGISGAKGRDKRPAFDRLLTDATKGRFDMVAAWSVDRLGRSLQHLVAFLGDLQACGCGLYLHKQALDTSTPSGRALFGMLGVFSEFERAMITERVNAGLARAKARGKVLGRPMVAAEIEDRIRELRAGGMGMLRISKTLGCGSSVVQRVLAAPAA